MEIGQPPNADRRASRARPGLAAVLVLGLALAAGVSQAGAGVGAPAGAPAPEPAELGAARDGSGGAGQARGCTRRLELLGLCKRPPHGHHPQADFMPYGGRSAGGGAGARGTAGQANEHGHEHPSARPHPHSHAPGNAHARGRTKGRTTLEQTIEGTGDPADGFQTLRLGKGERRIVREELARARKGRAKRRVSLLYAGQTTDWQLVDEESPARVELLDIAANPPFPSTVSAAWRPQEAFGPQAVELSIRQLNEFVEASPVTHRGRRRAEMEMVLMTGDQADNQQLNETTWVRTLLQGGVLDPSSGTDPSACPPGISPAGQTADPRRYAGVQDFEDYYEGLQFYDPERPMGPKYSDWPTYPGLMDRAQQQFRAQGLKAPTYVVLGNHDQLAQGNQKALLPFELVGVGCLKPLVPVSDLTEMADVLDPVYLTSLLTTSPEQVMIVPPDVRRQYVDKIQYKEIFLAGAQEDGHGFSFVDPDELEASNGAASYYAWTPKRGVRMIGLDTLCEGGITGPAANGNVDDPQFRWLEGELERATARDQLVVVFGHHPVRSLSCTVPDETPPPCTLQGGFGHDINPGCDLDPRDSQPLHDGADLTELFHRFPHVITYIAGHTHENLVSDFKRADGGPGDFWGIETASLIDWPPQNRLIELMDNCDGTLSIFGTTIDGAAPATAPDSGTPADGLGERDLASISRTLAFNDPQAGAGSGEGERTDRNVELLVGDPRRNPRPCRKLIGDGGDDGRDGGGGGGGGRDGEGDRDGDGGVGGVGADGGGAGDAGEGADQVGLAGSGRGALPFTGLLLAGLLVSGLALLAGGGLLRRLTG